jgi:hypothetical protein
MITPIALNADVPEIMSAASPSWLELSIYLLQTL